MTESIDISAIDDKKSSAIKPNSDIRRLLEEARRRLIQTGTRNKLIHCARFTKRGKFIDVVDERSKDIFRILVRDSRRMRFRHDVRVENEQDQNELLLVSGPEIALDESRFTDLILQTQLSEDKLNKRLLGMAREAKTLEEEQGINALYLALGFLQWFEDEKSEVQRQAPLVLLPVALKRNDLTSLYEVQFRGEDILTNEPLKQRLNADFGIRLPEIPEGDDWVPSSYFEEISQSISGKTRWSIDIDGIQLGFFSFAKHLMVKDLEPDNWAEESILNHPLLRGLLEEGFDEAPNDFLDGEKLDNLFAPADLIQIVDADSSQTLVIESVRKGRNLVVQGPPGTGKSQTITNIIAAAVHDGKSVLFMAEKMAALNVVHDRLQKAGLSEICLELHSRHANKRATLQELKRTIGASATPSNGQDQAEEIKRLRDKLNAVASVMHQTIGESGMTPYRVLSTLVRLTQARDPPRDVAIKGIENWTASHREHALQAAERLAKATERSGPLTKHLFHGVQNPNILPTDFPRLKQRLGALVLLLAKLAETAGTIAQNLHVDRKPDGTLTQELAETLKHVSTLEATSQPFAAAIIECGNTEATQRLLEIGDLYIAKAKAAGGSFSEIAVQIPVTHLRQSLAAGITFFGRLGSTYRRASSELRGLLKIDMPKRAEERIALIDRLIALQEARHDIKNEENSGKEILGNLWRGDRTDFAALADAVRWLQELLRQNGDVKPEFAIKLSQNEPQNLLKLSDNLLRALDAVRIETIAIFEFLDIDTRACFQTTHIDDVPFDELRQRLQIWSENLDSLDEWSRLSEADSVFRKQACERLADLIGNGEVPAEDAVDTLRYAHAEALYRVFAKDNAWITRLTFDDKAELVGKFTERERSRFQSTARYLRSRHLQSLPSGGMGAMGIIRAEIGKKRAHKPIRRLVAEAGIALQQIKPVFLMSPISIAQFLPPGKARFDLLVIDEASQVRPEDALGAIARVNQIVVVGDTKQLPPTSFFDRMTSVDSDDELDDENNQLEPTPAGATELESVLTLCEARGLSSRMLKWHYRSRHPSLIEVSNDEFYKDLILFPSPDSSRDTDGLVIRRVDGAYDRGGKRNNRIEADAVVSAVAAHARTQPGRSLGVATFSTAQRDIITELLELARREDEALDIFLREGKREEFFVKNLENVQGDERDVIYVSVGYGPRIAGQRLDSMAFGPVSTDGGERRLNVLFTRARYRTEIFASFGSPDIILDRTRSDGARVLKRFLAFAETGVSHQPQPIGDDPDSEFEIAVANVVRQFGYDVDYQVGSAGYKIDLAVRHPEDKGRYMLAIECDGATYHSALWARERDRLRQEVLEGLGWRFHRIWSTDWFHRRQEETRRLKEALTSAEVWRNVESDFSHIVDDEIEPEDFDTLEDDLIDQDTVVVQLPPYEISNFTVPNGVEPHEVNVARMSAIVSEVIDAEGPVHQEEIARRVGTLFGKQRAGARIAGVVVSALKYLKSKNPLYFSEDGFWFTSDQKANPPLRDRSVSTPTLRRADMIPPIEIAEAIMKVLRDNGALDAQDIPKAVAQLFGFQRTGPEFGSVVVAVSDRMMREGRILDGPSGLICS